MCGRHGGEERHVTQGDLVGSEGQVWVRCCDTRRRKGGQRRTQTSPGSHPEVGVDISGSEVPTEALPGVGTGYGTQERRQNTRRRNAAVCSVAVRRKRSGRGGRPRTQLSVGRAGKQGVSTGVLDSSLGERPNSSSEETVERHDSPSSKTNDDFAMEPLRKAAYGKTVRAV